jgi:hypothetical protein
LKWLFCWRCGQDMPMLDEQEFAVVFGLFRDGMRLTKHIEEQLEHPQRGTGLTHRFKACLDEFERMTGFNETNPNAVLHHRLALYGPPCSVCGKPLRTPKAANCMACGAKASPCISNDHAAAPLARWGWHAKMVAEENMTKPNIVIGEIQDPVACAKMRAQMERGERNLTWLEEHWPDLLPQARGKFVVVAAQEGHVADTAAEAWAWAKSTHPEDDGAIVQYVRCETGPRFYANRGKMA